MRASSLCICVSVVAGLAACGEAAAPAPVPATGVAITVSPLSLPGVTNARYRIVVANHSGATVADLTLTSDAYGDGAGGLTYVAPCDGDDNDNAVSLTVLGLYEGAGGDVLLSDAAWNDPGTVTRSVTCLPNTAVPVNFDLTLARSAQQGFFDVAIAFDDVFCSAKFDCLRDVNDPDSTIALLFNASGVRDTTFVLGFACTGGIGADLETWQYLDDLRVTCGGDAVEVDTGAGPGVLPAGAITQLTGSANPLFGAAVYRGQEMLGGVDKQYWNVALGFAGGAGCVVTTTGTASDGAFTTTRTTPADSTWPFLAWNVALTDGSGAIVCTQHPVGAASCPAAGVCVAYTPLDTPETFDHAFAAAPVGPVQLAGALSALDPGQYADGAVAASCEAYLHPTDSGRVPATTSGVYRVDPDAGGAAFTPFAVFCDLTTDGGGWTLVQRGANNDSGDLRTASAVGTVLDPDAGASGKLSRAALAALAAAGQAEVRYGHPNYGHLYLTNLPVGALYPGVGTNGYGTPVVSDVVATTLGGTPSANARFDWPPAGVPEVCSNTGAGNAECDVGLHLGTWAGAFADGVYMNHSSLLGGVYGRLYYRIWVR